MGKNELTSVLFCVFLYDFITKQDLTVVHLNLGRDVPILHTPYVLKFTHHKSKPNL